MSKFSRNDFVDSLNDSLGSSLFKLAQDGNTILYKGMSCKVKDWNKASLWAEKVISL